jgi:HPt (histidine-containing phosphotransfer) domain-containing protein
MINKQLFLDTFKVFDREVVVEIINIFFEEYPLRMENMDKNIADKNYKDLAFNAHSLKGVVSNFASPVLFELAREVEKMASALRDGNTDPDLIYRLNLCYPRMREATAEFHKDLSEIIKHYN